MKKFFISNLVKTKLLAVLTLLSLRYFLAAPLLTSLPMVPLARECDLLCYIGNI